MKIAIIGAGAAGCFCAIQLKRQVPSAEVCVFEALKKPLAKVAITGGGRCNLTNSFEDISSLSMAYPRGEKLMKRLFKQFSPEDTVRWFEAEGVALTLQEDHCYFPVSQDAMEIVHLLTRRMRELGVTLLTNRRISKISHATSTYSISFQDSDNEYVADAVVVTTGGSPKAAGLGMLDGLDLEIVPPVPSLFTFNLPGSDVRELMGAVVENAATSLAGTKFSAKGPLLITHWGMSGPAILKLSSYAARHLAENEYRGTLLVNWFGGISEQEAREKVMDLAESGKQKLIVNTHPEELSSRLWCYLVAKSGIRDDARWAELGSKGLNKLVNTLICDEYHVQGKSKFKEEFVTCGGVALSNIDQNTLQSKKHPGLYFAGEVLDVDAITGGFNLQAAWTMGHQAACSIAAGID